LIYNLDIDDGNACRALLARFELAVSETTLGGLLIALEGIAGQTVTDENGAIGPSEQASNAKEALSEAKSLYPTSVHACISEHLSTLIPKFFYFDHYSELKGRTESVHARTGSEDGVGAAATGIRDRRPGQRRLRKEKR
jgi:hypothetical protein